MGSYLYLVGAALLVMAFPIDCSGIRGGIHQVTATQVLAPVSEANKYLRNRVAWGVGIVGALVALALLVHDVPK